MSATSAIPEVKYEFLDSGTFILHNYNHAKPFSNFLPGVAGVWGIPLWAFFVSRGQGIACFGTADKNHSIMEFHSVNHHYRRAALEGFRTFLRVKTDNELFFYEPFKYENPAYQVSNRMLQTDHDLAFEEDNNTLGISIRVEYFALPNEPSAGLVRNVKIENKSGKPISIEMVDGFPMIIPYGINQEFLKNLPFTADGYMSILNLEKNIPYFTLANFPGDESETDFVDRGHFHFAFTNDGTKAMLAKSIIDPSLLFGELNDRMEPYRFFNDAPFNPNAHQDTICFTPSAFSYVSWDLPSGGAKTLSSFTGMIKGPDSSIEFANKIMQPGFLSSKSEENAKEIARIKDVFFVHSADRKLDMYTQHCFFDNVLRGGLPITLKAGEKKHTFHLYSRKHGDLERDYNFFKLEPCYFSQGTGNFRDINQNRRNDPWFNPDVGDENVKLFFSLLQPDGFNPLCYEGVSFVTDLKQLHHDKLFECVNSTKVKQLESFFAKPFTPGSLFSFLDEQSIDLKCQKQEFLNKALAASVKLERAEHGAGYWSDHWMYNFDLLESFCAIYPERVVDILLHDKAFTYFDTDVIVLPRSEKNVINKHGIVRQLAATAVNLDKTALIKSRNSDSQKVRIGKGAGDVYYSNLLGKILCLFVNKLASVAPSGVGIEMDGGRPGWCDSINGLPSLFGAGVPEVYRLIGAMRMITEILAPVHTWDQQLPEEVHSFLSMISKELDRYLESTSSDRDFSYWKNVSDAKETYRKQIELGFSGEEQTIPLSEILFFLDKAEKRLMASHNKALLANGLPASYATHEAVEYEIIKDSNGQPKRSRKGLVCVDVKKFSQHIFAPFLEGVIYRMALEDEPASCAKIRDTIRASSLYDRKLSMYKISSELDKESPEQGRTGGWPKGWFENESVFCHVQYKLFLQMLKSGLYKEFYEDIRKAFPPYLDMSVYGRSPIENVSFIVSSAHPRESYHGRGMQPRLSGVNAEMVNMMLIMSFGEHPFIYENNELHLRFSPVLQGSMFTTAEQERSLMHLDGSVETIKLPANSFSALFLGTTLVTYVNNQRKDTFGESAVKVTEYQMKFFDGSEQIIKGDTLKGDDVLKIRDRKVKSIMVILA